MLAEVQLIKALFHWKYYLLTLAILLPVPLMIAEVYYNNLTKAVCLNISPVPMGRDFVPSSVGLFKSTTLCAR